MTVNDKTLDNVYIIDNLGKKRRIKSVYIGVNGKAKKIADTISNLYKCSGTLTPLSQARSSLAATSIGDYALFGGGYDSSSSSVVDAYDTSLVRTTPTPLSRARISLSSTSIGNYALFGGGESNYPFVYSDVVDAYDTSLVKTTPTPLSVGRRPLAATSIGDYALFGGGNGGSFYAAIDAYDTSLVRTNPTSLLVGRDSLAATSIGNYALFGGGRPSASSYSSVVEAYSVKNILT